MNHHKLIRLSLLFLCFLSALSGQGAIISFENGVPAGWSTSKGKLSANAEKAKLGNNALCWEWTNLAELSFTDKTALSDISAASNGGVSMWIYNTVASDQFLSVCFYNNAGRQCSLPFKLNFKGWRMLLAEFGNDMGLPKSAKGTLQTMKIIAPDSGNGKIFIDCFELQEKVTWERMSDFQYQVKENSGIDSYLDARKALILTPVAPSVQEEQGIGHIRKRLDEWYLGTGKFTSDPLYQLRNSAILSYIQKGVRTAPSVLPNGTINGSGLFAHDFYGKKIDQIALNTFRNISESHLIQLAYDARINGNTNSLEKLFELFDWYYDQGWADGSALGTLRFEMLRSAGFHHSAMMVNHLLAERRSVIADTEAWFSRFGDLCIPAENPGELADYIRSLAMPKLFYALMLEQKEAQNSALKAFKNYMDNAMAYAPGFLGSLKPDGSGYHHRGPYNSAYYPDVLYAGCLIYYLLHDTPFAMSETSFANLKQALLSFRFFCGEYNIPGATTGRFPAQTEILQQLLPAFAYLIESSDDQDLIKAYKRLWKPENTLVKSYINRARTDICFSNTLGEIEVMLQAADKPLEPEANPTGSCFMPFSGLMVIRQQEWMITVKGFSKYIWDYEASATENQYGRYQSYGQTEYQDLKRGYRSYSVSKEDAAGSTQWDWRHLSGTTCNYISKEDLSYSAVKKHRNFSDQTFLGGIGLNEKAAMFTSRLHDKEISGTFFADKSLFAANNEIICLGSNIRNLYSDTPVTTTLFQNKGGSRQIKVNGKQTDVSVNALAEPVIEDNFGNVYLIHDGLVNIEKADFGWRAYIQHKKGDSDPATYAYTWLIQPTETQVEKNIQKTSWEILSVNMKAHAAYHRESKLLAASVFEPGRPVNIREIKMVSDPMLVLLQQKENGTYHLAVSKPDMDRPSAINNDKLTDAIVASPGLISEITLELEGIFDLTEADPDTEVYTQQNTTRITLKKVRDGKTYYAGLIKKGTGTDPALKSGEIGFYRNGNHIFLKHSQEREIGWTLRQMNGVTVSAGKGVSPEIDLNIYSSGLYILQVNDGNIDNTFKIIR
ncbi:MAG: chondroitinase family polysaccharide lyase [Bacteroidales bacterium]